MPSFTDQLGRTITLDHLPRRIISLVPSQTELLHTLGAPVVGITKFCVHPTTWFQEITRIGGTKDIDPATLPSSSTPSAVPPTLRTAYFIWRNPWMTVGGDTFIHDMLQRCGLTNLFATESRYPVVDPSTLSNCDLVLLSSEPYPFRARHSKEIQTLLPNAIVRLVDGELFSWYGSRLLQAPAYFRQFLQ